MAPTKTASDSGLAAAERRWRVVGFVVLALAALGVMVAILAAPIGVVADTECGSVLTSLFRISDGICGPSVQTRVLWAGLFGVAAAAMAFAARRSARH